LIVDGPLWWGEQLATPKLSEGGVLASRATRRVAPERGSATRSSVRQQAGAGLRRNGGASSLPRRSSAKAGPREPSCNVSC